MTAISSPCSRIILRISSVRIECSPARGWTGSKDEGGKSCSFTWDANAYCMSFEVRKGRSIMRRKREREGGSEGGGKKDARNQKGTLCLRIGSCVVSRWVDRMRSRECANCQSRIPYMLLRKVSLLYTIKSRIQFPRNQGGNELGVERRTDYVCEDGSDGFINLDPWSIVSVINMSQYSSVKGKQD